MKRQPALWIMRSTYRRWQKVALIAVGASLVAAIAIYGAMQGVALPWVVGGVIAAVLLAGCGHASFNPRWRWAAVIAAALLTGAIAGLSFVHLGLVLGGVLVVAGCVIRPPEQ